jgi:hypothetical protein
MRLLKMTKYALSRVPKVALIVWIKIAATTLGNRRRCRDHDAELGALAGTLLLLVLLFAFVAEQIVTKRFQPSLHRADHTLPDSSAVCTILWCPCKETAGKCKVGYAHDARDRACPPARRCRPFALALP